MKKNLIAGLLFFAAMMFNLLDVIAQDTLTTHDSLRKDALPVFLDCEFCDFDYVREQIAFINYMRDPKEASLHILLTLDYSGSGGKSVKLFFIGKKEFIGINDTLVYNSSPTNTSDEFRKGMTDMMKIGLLRYVSKTPLVNYFSVNYNMPTVTDKVIDPWDSWVFKISTSSWFNGEKLRKSANLYGSVDISRVTEKWKQESYFNTSYYETKYILDDTTLININKSNYFRNTTVKSLSSHWSAGGYASVNSSTFSNMKVGYSISPAIEYNLFPYSEATRKQLRFLYRLNGGYNYYNDTTIYNKTEQALFSETLSIALQLQQEWGSVSASVSGSHYLHDIDLNNIHFYTSLSIRIIKGLSFNMYGYISMIHDQISLPKGDATLEEILLSQRQLETQYSYYGSVGLSYTFGSIYNNVVNPRFGN